MDLPRRPLHLLSAGRTAVGLSMLASPSLMPRTMGVDSTTASRLTWMTRMVGAREVAVGAGTLLALRRGRDVEEWTLASLLCDGADAAAFGLAVAKGDVRKVTGVGVVASALGAVALGLLALRDLRG
jgi:hypothetical protein